MDFKVGDCLVYPLYGAGRIIEQTEKECDGKMVSYFTVAFPYGNLKMMVPAHKIEELGGRHAIEKNEIKKVIDYLKTVDVVESDLPWNKKQKENLEKLRLCDIYKTVEVYKLMAKKEKAKSLSAGEKKTMTMAEKIICSELHIVVGIDIEEAEKLIAETI